MKKRKPKERKSTVDQIKLLGLLKDFPCLYDKTSPKYMNVYTRSAAYKTICEAMGFVVDSSGLKKTKNLIDYVRSIVNNSSRYKSGQAAPSSTSEARLLHFAVKIPKVFSMMILVED